METGNDGMTLKDFSNSFPSSSDNKLSVIIMADSFFYAIFNANNTIVAHHSFEGIRYSNISSNQTILNDQNLKLDFDNISVLVINENGYLTSEEEDITPTFFPSLEHQVVYAENIDHIGMKYYFGLTPHQETLVKSLFAGKSNEVHSYPANFSRWYQFNLKNIVHIHIEKSFFLLYIQKDKRIVLSNFFGVNEVNDILYFVMAACKTTEINISDDDFFISGNIEKDSPLFSTLHAYIGNIDLVKTEDVFEQNEIPQASHPHHYFLHVSNIL
jgi:hypothetical protein